MVLDGLIPIYKQIKRQNETYCVFPFTKNKVDIDVFFDIKDNPFKLGFLVMKSNFQLWIDVRQGFIISTVLDPKDYKKLTDLLGLRYDPANPFSTNSFFDEFNKRIPASIPFTKRDHQNRLILYSHSIEDQDKLYFDGLIDWDKLGSDQNRSFKNLEKTRLLFPQLYNLIKHRNISVRYSVTRSNNEVPDKI